MKKSTTKWIVSLALLGVTSFGLGGGGTLPLRMGGEAKPVVSGNPVLASVQIESSLQPPTAAPRAGSRDALDVKAKCARNGSRFEAERGTIVLGSNVYSLIGVCANLASDDGSREIFASGLAGQVRIGDARLSGVDGSRVLTGNLFETRNNVEVKTFVVNLKETR